MAEKKKPSLFGKFFKGLTGEKVTSKEIQEAEGVVKRDPNNLRALHKLGDLYAKAEQFDKAIETYVQAATSYVERAFYQKAVAVYKQILKIRPAMHEIQERLAEVYLELGRRSDALAQYQGLASKHEKSGALSLAAEMILKMLHLDEDNVPLRVKLAELYLAMSENDLAIAEFEKALNSLANQSHWADYLKVGERLLFVSPTHLGALKTIARVYLDHGDVMKAMGKLQQAFKLDRRDPETLEVLAVAFDRLEQPEKTISVLKELAEIYASNGRTDYVRDVYQQILERDPSDAEIRQAYAALPPSESSQALPAAGGSSASRQALPAVSQSRQSMPAVGSSSALPAGVPVIKEPPPPPSFPDAPPPSVAAPPPAAPPAPPALKRAPPIAAPPPATPAPAAALEPSLSLSEEEIERLLNEADVYIKYGLVPRVEEALNRIFAAVPTHPEARRLKVELLKMQERTEEAAQELLALAKESQNPEQTLAFLEQVLELEDVSAALQEEAYQMTIRLSPGGSAAPPVPQAPVQGGYSAEPTMHITSADDLDLVEIEDLPSEAFATSADDLEIVSIDDLDVVSQDELMVLEDEVILEDEVTSSHLHAESTQAEVNATELHQQLGLPTPSYASEETQVISDLDELEIVELEEEVEPPAPAPLSFAPAEAPAAPPAPPMFSPPPPQEPPEDDAFSQFLSRNKVEDPIEDDDQSDFKDFLSAPLVVETNNQPAEPTRSGGGEELSEMEAAAARLAALIKAKEEAEAPEEPAEVAEEPAVESPPVPPPFAMPPPPMAPPSPIPASAAPVEEEGTNPSLAAPHSEPSGSLQEDELFAGVAEAAEFATEEALEEDFDFGEDGGFDELDDAFGGIQEGAETFGDDITTSTVDDGSYEDLSGYEEIEAIEFNPDDPFADEIEEASLYLDQDEPQYAIEIFDRILQQDPNHELAKAGLKLALDAESRIQEHVLVDDGFLHNLDAALGEIATTKRQRDRVEGELKAFKEEAEKQFGEDGEALFELGIAYHGMALYDMGVDSFRSCLRNEFRVFDCHKMIGACYSAQGQFDQALLAYNEALTLPGITTEERLDVLFETGETYESAGDLQQGLACFEEVSLLDENYRGVMRKIESIRSRL